MTKLVRLAQSGKMARRYAGHSASLNRPGSIYGIRKSSFTERMKQPIHPDQPQTKLDKLAAGVYLAGASGFAAGHVYRDEAKRALSGRGFMQRDKALRALKWTNPMKLAGIGVMGAGVGLQARSAKKQRSVSQEGKKSVSKSIFERQEVSKRYLYSEERARKNYDKANQRYIPNQNKAQKRILDEGFSNYRKVNPTYVDAAAVAGGLGSGVYMMDAGNKMMMNPFGKPSKRTMRNLKVAAAVGIPATIWNARGTARTLKQSFEWDRNLDRARKAGRS